MKTPRTYRIRRSKDDLRRAGRTVVAIAGVVTVTTFVLAMVAAADPRVIYAVTLAVLAGLGSLAVGGLILRLIRQDLTVDIELIGEDLEEDAEESPEAPAEEPQDEESAEPAEPQPSWYDLPYPDPDEEDNEDDAPSPPHEPPNSQHWSEGSYPDPGNEKSQ